MKESWIRIEWQLIVVIKILCSLDSNCWWPLLYNFTCTVSARPPAVTRTAVSAWCRSDSGRCCSPDGIFKRQHSAFIFNRITETSLLTRNELLEFYEVLRRSGVNCRLCSWCSDISSAQLPMERVKHQCWIYVALCFFQVLLTCKSLWSCNINMEGDIPDILEQFMSSSLVTWVSCSLLRADVTLSVCVPMYCYFCSIGYICFVL